MAKTLYYYDINGLGESIRYILHYTGEKFEDIRYKRKEWPIESVKNAAAYGQLPVWEEDGRKINQSIAIARYLGAKHNLVPTDLWEQAELDAAVLSIYDFFQHVRVAFRETDPVRKAELRKTLLETQIDYFMSRFEKQLIDNNGHVGKKLSWADFVFVGILEISDILTAVDVAEKYPTFRKLAKEITTLPGVKEYIIERGDYSL